MKATEGQWACVVERLPLGVESLRAVRDVIERRLKSVHLRPGQVWISVNLTREQRRVLLRWCERHGCLPKEKIAEMREANARYERVAR